MIAYMIYTRKSYYQLKYLHFNAKLNDALADVIEWLMGWPAGFKLNGPLDKFLGEMFLWIIQLWRGTF